MTRVSFFLIAAILGAALLGAISPVVKLVLVSALLAYLLNPVASFLESHGMTRTGATVSIFVSLTGILVISYFLLVPLFSREIEALRGGLNSEKGGVLISHLEDFLEANLSFFGVGELDLSRRIEEAMNSAGNWILAHVLDAASVVMNLILLPFITFFLLKDGYQFRRAFVSIVPNRYFELTLYVLHKLNTEVGRYLRGQFLDALAVGVLSTLFLWLLGVDYFLLLGVCGGLANLIPFFGPFIGGTVAVAASLLQTGNFKIALSVAGVFALIKVIDDVLLQPLIVARSVHLHPLTVLLTVLIGGKLFGILGMVLSVPVASFIKVALREGVVNYRGTGEA